MSTRPTVHICALFLCSIFLAVAIAGAPVPGEESAIHTRNSSSAEKPLPASEFESQQQRQGRNGYVDIYFSPFDPLSRLASLFVKGMHLQFAPTKRPVTGGRPYPLQTSTPIYPPHLYPGSPFYPLPPGMQYPGQPQPFPGQPMYPGQPFVMPGQIYPGQSYPGQPYPGQYNPGVQPYPGQYPGQTHAGQVQNPIPGQQQQTFPNQPGTFPTQQQQQQPISGQQPFNPNQPNQQYQQQQSTSHQSGFVSTSQTGNPPTTGQGTNPLYPPTTGTQGTSTAPGQYAPNQQYPPQTTG